MEVSLTCCIHNTYMFRGSGEVRNNNDKLRIIILVASNWTQTDAMTKASPAYECNADERVPKCSISNFFQKTVSHVELTSLCVFLFETWRWIRLNIVRRPRHWLVKCDGFARVEPMCRPPSDHRLFLIKKNVRLARRRGVTHIAWPPAKRCIFVPRTSQSLLQGRPDGWMHCLPNWIFI